MTAYPNRVREQPGTEGEFVRVLTKPMDLEQLRQIVRDALADKPASQPAARREAEAAPPSPAPATDPGIPAAAFPQSTHAPSWLFRTLQSTAVALVIACVLGFFLFFVLGVRLPGMSSDAVAKAEETPRRPAAGTVEGVSLVEGRPHTLQLPAEVRVALGIRKG